MSSSVVLGVVAYNGRTVETLYSRCYCRSVDVSAGCAVVHVMVMEDHYG